MRLKKLRNRARQLLKRLRRRDEPSLPRSGYWRATMDTRFINKGPHDGARKDRR